MIDGPSGSKGPVFVFEYDLGFVMTIQRFTPRDLHHVRQVDDFEGILKSGSISPIYLSQFTNLIQSGDEKPIRR